MEMRKPQQGGGQDQGLEPLAFLAMPIRTKRPEAPIRSH